MDTISYHLHELDIALDSSHQQRILPTVLPSDRRIVDIGCGIGQSLLALDCADRECIGIDIDIDALDYGRRHYGDKIHYMRCNAAQLPLANQSVDLIFSRVALPYTNIPKALKEIRRCLVPGGRVWMTLHPKAMIERDLQRAIKARKLWNILFNSYKLANGYLLEYAKVTLPFVNGQYESWQSSKAISSLLKNQGFEILSIKNSPHLLVEARLSQLTRRRYISG